MNLHTSQGLTHRICIADIIFADNQARKIYEIFYLFKQAYRFLTINETLFN